MALRPDNALTPDDKRARAQAAQEDVLLREVDEALREQQVVDIAKRYGKLIGGGIVLLLAGLGGYLRQRPFFELVILAALRQISR